MSSQVTERPRRLLPIPSLLATMILYLLVPALILGGNVDSQTANRTEEELSKVEGNQTLRESPANSAMKPDNVTSSLYKDEKSLIEDELQNNQTSNVITEDDESFQDQENEFAGQLCKVDLLKEYSYIYCGNEFNSEMMSISTDNWCVLGDVIRPYNNMTVCLERLSNMVGCYYPNPTIQDFFLYIHSNYFVNCSKEDVLLEDAPQGMVIALTLIPVSLIPLLVYMVVWKSNVQE
ncbi:receptor activity-modifying protein 2-like isoform X2 [Perca fluviatilis]|uniref:receptor activity-modifying protein 2-like isoform X2 n=1 Tax=Perca fluviatilis TaxID=8168 RepID=UPI0019652B2A|nr:receptor activity-modifying protein 2-like isoform X2 [Perca fluviatilis]